MNKKVYSLAVVFLLSFSAVFVTASFMGGSESPIALSSEYEKEFTNRNVVVFSDDILFSEIENDLTDSTHNINKKSNINDIGTGDIAVISESWIYLNDQQKINRSIETAIRSGIPLIFVGNDSYLYNNFAKKLGAIGYSENESVYCIYVKDGVNFTNSIVGYNEEKAIQLAYSWADAALSDDQYNAIWNFSWLGDKSYLETPPESEPMPETLGALVTPSWGLISLSSTTKNCSPHGNLVINASTYKLMDFNDGNKYYAVHYRQLGEPDYDNGYRLADIYLEGNPVTYFYDHGPATTSGSTTVSVSMGSSIGITGPTVGATIGWSYTKPDVMITNGSQISTQKVNIWHDVDESKAVAKGYVAEPGITVKIPNTTTNFTHSLTHKVQMCKNGLLGTHWSFSTYSTVMAINLP